MDALADLELSTIGGGLALLLALVQLAVRKRVDLGGVTLAAVALTGLLSRSTAPLGAVLLGVAVVVCALASRLAADRGVGRPELLTLVVAAAVLGALAVDQLPALGVEPSAVRGAAAGTVTLAGVISALLARDRRGLRGQRVYHWREVPIVSGGPTSSRPTPPDAKVSGPTSPDVGAAGGSASRREVG